MDDRRRNVENYDKYKYVNDEIGDIKNDFVEEDIVNYDEVASTVSSNISDYVPKFRRKRINVLNYNCEANTWSWKREFDEGQYDEKKMDVVCKMLNGVLYYDIDVENITVKNNNDELSYPGSEMIEDPTYEAGAEMYWQSYIEDDAKYMKENVVDDVVDILENTSVLFSEKEKSLFSENEVVSWNVKQKEQLRSSSDERDENENTNEEGSYGDDCDIFSDLTNDNNDISYDEEVYSDDDSERDLSFIVTDDFEEEEQSFSSEDL